MAKSTSTRRRVGRQKKSVVAKCFVRGSRLRREIIFWEEQCGSGQRGGACVCVCVCLWAGGRRATPSVCWTNMREGGRRWSSSVGEGVCLSLSWWWCSEPQTSWERGRTGYSTPFRQCATGDDEGGGGERGVWASCSLSTSRAKW